MLSAKDWPVRTRECGTAANFFLNSRFSLERSLLTLTFPIRLVLPPWIYPPKMSSIAGMYGAGGSYQNAELKKGGKEPKAVAPKVMYHSACPKICKKLAADIKWEDVRGNIYYTLRALLSAIHSPFFKIRWC
jgi:hypothetical protein